MQNKPIMLVLTGALVGTIVLTPVLGHSDEEPHVHYTIEVTQLQDSDSAYLATGTATATVRPGILGHEGPIYLLGGEAK